ncbi:cytochrome p450 domain-containing protein [Apiospora sp. TS-2023a]
MGDEIINPGFLQSQWLNYRHLHLLLEPIAFIVTLGFLLAARYAFSWGLYHKVHVFRTDKRVPPTLPYIFPLLGNAIPFAFDSEKFIKKATQYAGSLVPVRLSVIFGEIFLFQGPENVAAVWKEPRLGSPIWIYIFALEYVFNMPKHALVPYRADNSGSHRKPHPQSNVLAHNRVDFLTHMQLFKVFGGTGLNTSFKRCASILKHKLDSLPISTEEWTEMPGLYSFFQNQLGAAVLEGLYGPSLTEISPQFLDDLWIFDRATPKFAKRFPRFLMPDAYRARERLLASIQRWYLHARAHFRESDIGPDGDADPFWGSELVRSRQKVLLAVDRQDDKALAAADLGLIWASVTNVVPSSMMCALHIFRSPGLCDRLRASLSDTVDASDGHIDMDKVLRKPLLSSVYAETLRLHLQAYVTRSSPHADVKLASWWLPKNRLCMVNTYASHMDAGFWNTRDGTYPVESFWAERFLIDPNDPKSGPVRHGIPNSQYTRPAAPPKTDQGNDEPFFSVEGLEGAWIPYGGGYAACPGRHFAKRIIFYTTSTLLSMFDVQILTDELDWDSSSFGLGTQKPKQQIRFRIKKRASTVLLR